MPIDINILLNISLFFIMIIFLVYFLVQKSKEKSQEKSKENHNASQLLELTTNNNERMQLRMQEQERAITKLIDERLYNINRNIGDNLDKQTTEQLKRMNDLSQRLGIISGAQQKLEEFSKQIVDLQSILGNRHARGAFGEIQMQDQIRGMLPSSVYEFQATLSNGKRVDCLLKLPGPPGSICLDAKFPLEGYRQLQTARKSGSKVAIGLALKQFKNDVEKHINDISDKYIIDGETASSALMFVPSEAVYAELHAELPSVIDKSYVKRVYIVSPTTLMATLNTIRAILRDGKIKEQANIILKEVGLMNKDVTLLDKRAGNLQSHFNQIEKDVHEIRISTSKIIKRSDKMGDFAIEEDRKEEEKAYKLTP